MREHGKLIGLYLVLLLLGTVVVFAQRGTRWEDEDETKESRVPLAIAQPAGVALDGTVDPSEYFVGPADAIAVNIWTSPPLSFALTVTPEGTLIVPTVGELKVADLTLTQAKERIISEARKRYLTAQVTATLVKPRSIMVTVLGHVPKPGAYRMTAVDRADAAIDEASRGSTTIPDERSKRNIILTHNDGSKTQVDILKFLVTKEDKWNPYLREGDVIAIPNTDMRKNFFAVYGAVNVPGRFEFVDGDSVLEGLQMAQGFSRGAIRDSAELSQLSPDGTVMKTRIINLEAIAKRTQPNIALVSGDRILVKVKPEMREDYTATVGGEVIYPGIYPITKNQTKLSEIIREAGGFTEFAELKSAELNRRSISLSDIDMERLTSLRGGVTPEDSGYYHLETDLRIRKEIVNVDFHKLFEHRDSTQDVLLQSGDYIYVPSIRKTVYVFGQIVTSGHIPFVEGEHLDYYIKEAGGFTDLARKGDVKIVKARTKQWLSPSETTIEEGDYIWVPREIERSFGYYMNIIGQTSAVLSVALSVVLLVMQSKK